MCSSRLQCACVMNVRPYCGGGVRRDNGAVCSAPSRRFDGTAEAISRNFHGWSGLLIAERLGNRASEFMHVCEPLASGRRVQLHGHEKREAPSFLPQQARAYHRVFESLEGQEKATISIHESCGRVEATTRACEESSHTPQPLFPASSSNSDIGRQSAAPREQNHGSRLSYMMIIRRSPSQAILYSSI